MTTSSTARLANPGASTHPSVGSALASAPPLVLALLSAGLLWLSFPPVRQALLGWVALVPLLLLIASPRSERQVLLAAWVGGMVFWHMAVSWVRLTDPSAWLAWVAMATFLSLGWPMIALITRAATRRLGWPFWIAAPLAILTEEYYRAHVLTGFPWYLLAHTQARVLPVIQISDLAGAWGVSLLVAVVNAALAVELLPGRVSSRAVWRRRGAVLGVLALSLIYGGVRLGTARFEPGPRLTLLQSNLKQELKMGAEPEVILAEYIHLVERALPEEPDVIIWPETAYPRGYPAIEPGLDEAELDRQIKEVHPLGTIPFWREKEKLVQVELQDWVDAIGVPMVVGTTTYAFQAQGMRRFNSAILFQPGETGTLRYDKLHLVPFGEYVPLLETFPWLTRLTPYDGDFIPRMVPGQNVVGFDVDGLRYATAICFEDSLPGLVREFFQPDDQGRVPDVLLDLSNDGWFQGSSLLDMHLAVSVFRAVEMRVPIARAVNTGISALIDGNGRIREELPKLKAAPLTVDVPLDPRRGPYVVVGDWLPIAACVTTLLVVPGLLIRQRMRPLPA